MHRFSRTDVFIALVVTSALIVASCGRSSSSQGPETAQAALGQRTYKRVCITCHQADGRGISGVYPTLHRTRWTLGDRGRLIRLVLHGMEGPVEVKGQPYNQLMPPLGGQLSDEEVAAVLTFVRQHFGNDVSAITPAEVAAVRQVSKQQSTYDPSVLWKTTGVPKRTQEHSSTKAEK